jgi:hypothetical protein
MRMETMTVSKTTAISKQAGWSKGQRSHVSIIQSDGWRCQEIKVWIRKLAYWNTWIAKINESCSHVVPSFKTPAISMLAIHYWLVLPASTELLHFSSGLNYHFILIKATKASHQSQIYTVGLGQTSEVDWMWFLQNKGHQGKPSSTNLYIISWEYEERQTSNKKKYRTWLVMTGDRTQSHEVLHLSCTFMMTGEGVWHGKHRTILHSCYIMQNSNQMWKCQYWTLVLVWAVNERGRLYPCSF